MAIRWRSDELERLRREMQSFRTKTLAVIGGGSLILGATLLLVLGPGQILSVTLTQVLAAGGLVTGGMLLTAGWR